MKAIPRKINMNTQSNWEQVWRLDKNKTNVRGDFPTSVMWFYEWMLEQGVVPQKGVVNIGCGSGRGVQVLHECGMASYGLDLSNVIIKHNQNNYKGTFFQYDANIDPLPQEVCDKCDVAMSFHMLEHLANAIYHIRHVLKYMSYYLISVPYKEHWDCAQHMWRFDEQSFKNSEFQEISQIVFTEDAQARLYPGRNNTITYILKTKGNDE